LAFVAELSLCFLIRRFVDCIFVGCPCGRYLYALDPSHGSIDMFQIEHDGSLTNLGAINAGELSIFAQGIAVR
jgi:hypothetical protein